MLNNNYCDKQRKLLMSKPIFIVGTASSGTTVLRNILWSHPHYYSSHETNFYVAPYRSDAWYFQIKKKTDDILKFELDWINECPEYSYDYLKQLSAEYSSRRDFVEAYFASVKKYNRGDIWIEKTPDHICFLPEINKDFPESIVICITRNPLDSVLSISRKEWFYGDFNDACREWKRQITGYLSNRNLINISISYEWFCAHPEKAIKSLFFALKIDYHDEEKHFYNILRSSEYSHAAVISCLHPINKKSIGKAGKTISSADRSVFERLCGKFLHHEKMYSYLNTNFCVFK